VAQIDTPCINEVHITFFNQLIFDVPRFCQFLSRTEHFRSPNRATVTLDRLSVKVGLSPPMGVFDDAGLLLRILCTEQDWQLSSMAHLYNSFASHVATLEQLCIREGLEDSDSRPQFQAQVDMDDIQWLEFFQPFTAVKDLYLSEEISLPVVRALRELSGERITEVLPTLQNIFLRDQPSEPIQEPMALFIAARELCGCPVAVHCWEKE